MDHLCYMDAMLTLAGNRLSSRICGIRQLGKISNWIIRIFIAVSSFVSVYLITINNIPTEGLTPRQITALTSVILGLAATA